MHRESDFSHLYNAIEKRMKESPLTTTNETAESNVSPQPLGNVTASNGSTAIGNIQVGGNLSGNIVIGNNNSVNNKK
jgi:hypothetical protein